MPAPCSGSLTARCLCTRHLCRRLSKDAAADILKANLDAAYAGNRAPLNVYVHPFWLRATSKEHGDNLDQLQEFVGEPRTVLHDVCSLRSQPHTHTPSIHPQITH